MITYQEACKIAKKELKDCFELFNKITVTEIEEGWVFLFNIEGKELTPPPQRLIRRDSGEVKCFPIPPIDNLKKLHKGKKIEFIDE